MPLGKRRGTRHLPRRRRFLDLFRKMVLERLDPIDSSLLARAGSAARTAVVRSGLPSVGHSAGEPRVDIDPF